MGAGVSRRNAYVEREESLMVYVNSVRTFGASFRVVALEQSDRL